MPAASNNGTSCLHPAGAVRATATISPRSTLEPARGKDLLDVFLEAKKREASLLFAIWDSEDNGAVPMRHLRPLLLSVFPAPSAHNCAVSTPVSGKESGGQGETPCIDAKTLTALHAELLSARSVRAAYESLGNRCSPSRLSSSQACTFTLSELHTVMETLFQGDVRSTAALPPPVNARLPPPQLSMARISRREASATVTTLHHHHHHNANHPCASSLDDEDDDERFARTSMAVLPTPRWDAKEPLDDSPNATPRGGSSSVGGHSVTSSVATTAMTGTAASIAPTLGSTFRVESVTASSATAAVAAPPQQLALAFGCLVSAFGSLRAASDFEETQSILPPFVWTVEERSAVAAVVHHHAPGRLDAFMKLVL